MLKRKKLRYFEATSPAAPTKPKTDPKEAPEEDPVEEPENLPDEDQEEDFDPFKPPRPEKMPKPKAKNRKRMMANQLRKISQHLSKGALYNLKWIETYLR